jgi:hypothetical protein
LKDTPVSDQFTNLETITISIFTLGQSLNDKLCGNEGNLPLPKGILVQGVDIFSSIEMKTLIQDNLKPWKGFAN